MCIFLWIFSVGSESGTRLKCMWDVCTKSKNNVENIAIAISTVIVGEGGV